MNKFNFFPFPQLQTERLVLRQLSESDKQEIFFLRTDERNMKFISRLRPKTIDEVSLFINDLNEDINNNELIYWAISLVEYPKLIGTICLWNFSNDKFTAEIGYELNPHFHGKGIMNEAIKLVVGFSFNTLKLDSIEAYTNKNNIASTNLLMKNDFKRDCLKTDEKDPDNNIFILKNSYKKIS